MKQKKGNRIFFILGLASILLLLMAGQILAQGTFSATGSMTAPRVHHSETLLNDGRVLIVGGNYTANWWEILNSAEIYDPATGTFTLTGSMSTTRTQHTATLLDNGKVLITGGSAPGQLASAELYDPGTGTFTTTGSMTIARYMNTATLLTNGKVLVVGGQACSSPGCGLASAELYDPASGVFIPTGSMTTVRQGHTATLLANGNVLIAGGDNEGPYLASAELYDPGTGTFTTTGSMSTPREYHTATLLNNGEVLVVGGAGPLASTELYDSATGLFTPTGSMSTPRLMHTATLLNNGEVLVVGGYNGSVTIDSAELYDPASGTFAATGSMITPRLYHTATLLNNGEVLETGGWISQNSWSTLDSAELYTPVNQPPEASPTSTPNAGVVPLTVQFAANALDPDNDPLTFAWDFGDPTSSDNTSNLSDPEHIYLYAGTYVAQLTVSDGKESASYSLTITVEPGITLSVCTATVKWWNVQKTIGAVGLWADFEAEVPADGDMVAIYFDNIQLFAAPFSAFKPGLLPGAYWLAKNGMIVRFDFTNSQLLVVTPKMTLLGLDNVNGVDVELMIGSVVATENIMMKPAPFKMLIYRRPGCLGEPQ